MSKKAYQTRIETPKTRDPVPAVAMPRRICRGCGSGNVTACGGSHVNAVGNRVQYCVCRDCGQQNIFVYR